jgi:hypothetical protein
MRWYRPQPGDFRVKTFFAWIPVMVETEARWLEQVIVRQRYVSGFSGSCWVTVEFIDRKSGGAE